MKKFMTILIVGMILLFTNGCRALLPSAEITVQSRWQDYSSAKKDYDKIIPEKTSMEDLVKMGFTPYQEPNIKILTATDVVNLFMPNPSIKIEDLDEGIQKCIKNREKCTAYRIEPSIIHSKRIGNFWLDLFTFKRDTISSGWEFRGLITIVDDLVTYRDPSAGRPSIKTEEIVKKPLGPLQEIGGLLPGAAPGLWR